MKIRKAILSDAKGIAKVQVDSWRTTYHGILPEDFLNSLSYEQQEQKWLRIIPQYHVFVAENPEGEIIGFASGGKNRFEEYGNYPGELYAIYILKDYQRVGIGKLLVKAIADELVRQSMNSMIVLVLEENPSRYFYEALGAKLIARREDTIGGKKLTELVYGWDDIRNLKV
ncbi:MAG: GNAT family N-acetyltransferase [Thermosediminibacteraceae bacterium]|nr:GNAT family N-acetyltransferase [Thermosediminibacteraceae bacterium]PZN02332.1 MAG: GNAT family N-acetyltransferase [Bacillota bacterium]